MARYINCTIVCDDCDKSDNARVELGRDIDVARETVLSVGSCEYPKGWLEDREYGYGYSDGRDVLYCPECAKRHKKGSW